MTLQRNSSGRATIQKTLMSQSIPDTPDSPALTQWSPQGSTQNTMAGVTTLWHLKKATDPYVNSTGNLTLHIQLKRKADLHVSLRDEA